MKQKWLFVVGVAIIILGGLTFSFRGQVDRWRTLNSLQKVDDYPLYVMTYYGDYGFKDFLQTGRRAELAQSAARQEWACSVFSTLDKDGNPMLARNFDWHNRAALLLYTDPPDGYASVSLVDVQYLGFNKKEPSWSDRRGLVAAPYWPFDGMNEVGLAVGMMAVPYAQSSDDPEKVTLDSLQAIRLLLDYAQDVDQAIALLQNYNIDFGGGPPLHYLVADAAGSSAVIEFIDGQMVVLRPDKPWQVSTNFLISQEQPEGADSSCRRYNRATEILEQTEGNITPAEAMTLLENVSQGSTMWSVVYGLTTGDIQIAMGRQYSAVKKFKLEMTIEHPLN
jgi:predicted choloylglycine hydrolase